MSNKIFTFIFARGGSKGIKNKNIVLINNKPLIYYSIKLGKKISGNNVYVSTDSEKIKKISTQYGARIIPRPHSLAKDRSSERDAWIHAIKYLQKKQIFFDIFLSLPTTSPLRNIIDIKKSIKLIKKCDFVFSGSKSKRSPWFNMVKKDKNNNIKILIEKNSKITTRQMSPKSYDLTTAAYVSRPNYILSNKNFFSGKALLNEIPEERALDIDTQYDLKIARLLINGKNN